MIENNFDTENRIEELRNVSVDKCEIIGQGTRGTVYRCDDGTAIKVYNNGYKLSDILRERDLARWAFSHGIPTAMSYNVVKVGESYGAVLELLDAKTYSDIISSDFENADKYIFEYVKLLRKIHTTIDENCDMPDVKVFVSQWLECIRGNISDFCMKKLESMLDDIPNTKNMLHCDYHTNNVMKHNGETILVDMDTLSHGHPVFEFANMYVAYKGFGENDPDAVSRFLGVSPKISDYIWKRTLEFYFDTEDEIILKSVEDKARIIAYLRMYRYYESNNNIKAAESTAEKLENAVNLIESLSF